MVLEVPPPTTEPTTEIEPSHEIILQNITPKQNIRWRHRELLNTISSDWFPPMSVDPTVEAPVDYYFRYVSKQLFDIMAEMTNIYAIHSNKPRFKPTTTQEIEILFGLHLATGIFSYPCLKMFWETGISIPLFSENMARDRFFELRNNLHLVDNTIIPAGCKDAFYKVRPIFDAVRNRCLELPLEKELCVDEQMVPFTGRPSGSSPTPQIIPRRPGEVRPVADIARDGFGHFPAHDEGLGTRCKMVGCKGRTRIKCIKCKVHLCLTKDKICFLAFHT